MRPETNTGIIPELKFTPAPEPVYPSGGLAAAVSNALAAVTRRLRGRWHRRTFGATQSPEWLQSVISNPYLSDSLRERIGKIHGGEKLEFMLAYWHFDKAGNSLQRFEQLRTIIHRFVRENAERPIGLPDRLRQQILDEWNTWSAGHRVPMDLRLPSLEKSAIEIHEQIVKHGPLGPRDEVMRGL